MPRTEKRFGVVNQPASTAVEELVPSAATTRNLLINATARSAAVISAAIYSGAYSNDVTGGLTVSAGASINLSNYSTVGANAVNTTFSLGKHIQGAHVWVTTSSSGLLVIDAATGSARYVGGSNAETASRFWRSALESRVLFKMANAGGGSEANAKLNNGYVSVSSTDAIGIGASISTSATANYDMFDRVGITHVAGTSISDTTDYNVGEVRFQGTGDAGRHGGGAYALQDGVGYLMHFGTSYVYETTSGRVGLGLYIFSSSSSTFGKRAYWNCDGTAGKVAGYALAYFVASDYNSTHQVFALSQPSTTTSWSGIAPSASTSWPAGYTLPADAAPAGFRIVSNSGTTEPDVNFLTGTITYPAAPTGVDVPALSVNRVFQVCSLKFSPDNTKLAVAYSRNYSGTGNTNSVVVVYTRQNDGSWTHTHSSGSAIRYMPDNPDCMTWSADGSYINIAASSATDTYVITQNVPFNIDRWHVASGSAINNSSVTSWTVASSKYPDFSSYLSPKTGTSTVGAISGNTSTLGGATTNNYTIRSISAFGDSGTTGSVFANIDQVTATSGTRTLQGFVMQGAGTVGTSGQPATNYVTMAVSDLSLTAGQTTQVSNIVLHSGERMYAQSSTSNSVDISAHGIEST